MNTKTINTWSLNSNKRIARTLVFVMASLIAMTSWALNPASSKSVAQLLRTAENVSLFVNALEQSGLIKQLETAEQVTVFVPTDSAMNAEGSAFLLKEVLLAASNETRLHEQLSHHIILGEHPAIEQLGSPVKLETFANTCLQVDRIGSSNKVGPESVVTGTVQASNGTLYFVDRLLWSAYNGSEQCGLSLTRY